MTVEFSGVAKARQLREYFARHGRIYIVVNATDDDVIVPEYLHNDSALRLVLNVRMPQIIIIRDGTLESEFSFSGNLFRCCIPMHAIWAAYVPEQKIEDGILWEEDIPDTIRTVVKAVGSMREENRENMTEGTQPTDTLEPEPPRRQHGRRVSHLRVIK